MQTVLDQPETELEEPLSRETIEQTDRVYETDGKDLMRVRFEPVRMFGGFRVSSIIFVSVIAALVVWNTWTTREIVVLRRHRLVSVSLASLITDFVRDQSHAQGTSDEAAMRTRLYLVATQKALIDLARNGTPVVASEAVLGNSVPDDTAAVKAAVAKAMAAEPGQH